MKKEFIFTLPQFEGSLDLLLYLVKKHEMDIKDIKISIIADEFLEYINRMKKLDIDLTSDFMVTASTLMELKSKILLPNKSNEDIEIIQKAKRELSERLLAYQRMKVLAKKFKEKLDESLRSHPVRIKKSKGDILIDKNISMKLKEIFEHVARVIKSREKIYKIKGEKYSVAKKMEDVWKVLERDGNVKLEKILFAARDRIELIVIFLAVLELIKLEKASLVETNEGYNLEVMK